jgi:hypothetical protein
MPTFVRNNSLALFFGLIFVLAVIGQAFAGQAELNNMLVASGLEPVSLSRYVTSSDFGVDVMENWQSEYLQFALYVFATVWLVQQGSPESKPLGELGTESDEDQMVGKHATDDSPSWARAQGFRRAIFSRSLGTVMLLVFLLSWFVMSLSGRVAYNEEQLADLQPPLTYLGYLTSADFWGRTLQNWQSEFLAVGSMAVFAIYLRQRGSPESKPVGAPHSATGVES